MERQKIKRAVIFYFFLVVVGCRGDGGGRSLLCVCVCVCACVRACVRACARVYV